VSASGGAVAADGANQSVSGTTSTYFGFSATAGDNIGIGISNLTMQNSYYGYAYVYVYGPDGSRLGTYVQCNGAYGGCDVNLSNLPTTGLYGVVVQSASARDEPNLTMSFTATVSHDQVTPLTAGTPVTANLSRNGQNGRFTFSGTAGATATVQISGLSTTPSGRLAYLTVYGPDGTSLSSGSTSSSYTFNLTNLPATGTYTVFVNPQLGSTATLQVTQN
jgi:hypothetical protein